MKKNKYTYDPWTYLDVYVRDWSFNQVNDIMWEKITSKISNLSNQINKKYNNLAYESEKKNQILQPFLVKNIIENALNEERIYQLGDLKNE